MRVLVARGRGRDGFCIFGGGEIYTYAHVIVALVKSDIMSSSQMEYNFERLYAAGNTGTA